MGCSLEEYGVAHHTEKVDVLVDGVAGNGGEAQLINELAADVDNLALQSTALQRLGAGSLEVLWGSCLVPGRGHESLSGLRSIPS